MRRGNNRDIGAFDRILLIVWGREKKIEREMVDKIRDQEWKRIKEAE